MSTSAASPASAEAAHVPVNFSRALREAPEQREMALIVGLAFFLNLFPGSLLQLLHTRWGLVITQVLFIAGPAFVAVRWFYLDRLAVLPMRRPSARQMFGAVVTATALNYLLTVAGGWQERIAPTPESFQRFYHRLFIYHGPVDFVLVLLVFAVIPAVCEEVLFRGFLQAGLVQLFESAPKGIAGTAFIFAAFHLNPWMFPEILVLGVFLGLIVQRSGSLLPAIAAHALNNILSISAAAGVIVPDAPIASLWSLGGGILMLAVGLRALRRRRL